MFCLHRRAGALSLGYLRRVNTRKNDAAPTLTSFCVRYCKTETSNSKVTREITHRGHFDWYGFLTNFKFLESYCGFVKAPAPKMALPKI